MAVRLLPVLVILTAITVIGINGNYAYAESGVAQISNIFSQGGVSFDVLDLDGVESVVFFSNTQSSTPAPTENRPTDPTCPNPLEMSDGFFDWPEDQGTNGPSEFDITDCSTPPVTYRCEVFHPTASSVGRMGTCTCIENCDSQQPTTPVGGEFLPIKTTSLLLAGAQTFSWMIPLVLSGIGIGLVVFSRKSENS